VLSESPASREIERSEKMLNLEMTHRDFESVEDVWAIPTPFGGQELVLLLATQEEARTALAREHEHAAIEAEDVLSQADEALVMG